MGLKFAENLRKNRRDGKFSQQTFAERIGVSFQTVSKWERGECYPDIEMLPRIAAFFGITIDNLLGADLHKEKEYVDELQEKLRRFDIQHDEASLVKHAEQGLEKYPNNHLLMAWIVYGAQNINPQRSIELGEYLVENCRNNHILNWVKTELCYAYFKSGLKSEGIAMARRLPGIQQTCQAVLSDLLSGKERTEHILRSDIAKVCFRFKSSILKIIDDYDPYYRIELLKKSNAVYDAVYETDDCVSALKEKADNCVRIAGIYMLLGDEDSAREYTVSALEYAKIHDALPYGTTSAAILNSCEKHGILVTSPGRAAHPYGKLREQIISSVISFPGLPDIVSDLIE